MQIVSLSRDAQAPSPRAMHGKSIYDVLTLAGKLSVRKPAQTELVVSSIVCHERYAISALLTSRNDQRIDRTQRVTCPIAGEIREGLVCHAALYGAK